MHNSQCADTLSLMQEGGGETLQMVDSLSMRSISVEEMFGAESCAAESICEVVAPQTLIGDVIFQILAVAMMFLVVYFIARQRHSIARMFVGMLKGRLPEEFASGRRDEAITRTFLHAASVIGVMLVMLFAAKYAPVWMPESLAPAEGWIAIVAALYTLIAIISIALFESVLLWIVGRVTRSEESVGALLYMKRAGFAVAAIALSPVFLLGVLSSEKLTDIWNIILIAECVVLVFLFLKETLVFFIDKKIPIFHWILYLCAAEVFPLSLIWALVTRS